MDAIQRLRAKADAAGDLESNEEQTVTVEQAPANVEQNVTVEGQAAPPPTIIKIEPANPQVVYVPTYNPTVVYGAWPYPAYPPYYYYPPGYVATASVISFGVGLAVGAALWGGCSWGWGHSNVNINVNRYNNCNRTNISNNNWRHNADHRKGAQYRDAATRQKYDRGDTKGAQSREAFRGRADQGRQELDRGGRQPATQREQAQRIAPRKRRSARAQQRAGVTGAMRAPSRMSATDSGHGQARTGDDTPAGRAPGAHAEEAVGVAADTGVESASTDVA